MTQTRTVNMLDRPPKRDVASLHVKGPRVVPLEEDEPAAPARAEKYQIDTDVPIPGRPGKQSVAAAFPWAKLEVGHSFVVPGANSYKTGNFWCKWAMKQWPTKRFVYRKVEGGVRIWRVEVSK